MEGCSQAHECQGGNGCRPIGIAFWNYAVSFPCAARTRLL